MKKLKTITSGVVATALGVVFILGCKPIPCETDSGECPGDMTPPEINISGERVITLRQGETYVDAGATAMDEEDGAVDVSSSGSVNTAIVATYIITYSATDKAGNTATAARKINVTGNNSNNEWRYPYKNLQKTAEDEHVYAVASGKPEKQWMVNETLRSVRLGDVTGDGEVDIVGLTADGIKVFNSAGEQQGKTLALHEGADFLILENVTDNQTLDMVVGSKKTASSLRVVSYRYNQGAFQTLTKTGGYDFERMRPIASLGDDRLVVQYSSEYSGEPRGYSLWDLKEQKERWYYDIGPIIYGGVSIADINQDGLKEMVADVFSSHNGARGSGYNGNGTLTTDGDLYTIVINEKGDEVFTRRLGDDESGDNTGSNGRGYHNFVDMDGDGSMEIVSLVGHDTRYYQGTSQIKITDNLGNKIYQTAVGYNAFYGRTYIIADLDRDGYKEIIVNANQINKFLIYNHELTLIASLDNTDYTPVFASDIDGDGNKEIIAKKGKKLYALSLKDNKVTEKWSLSFNSTVLDAVVSDLNRDKQAELVITTENNVHKFEMTAGDIVKDLPIISEMTATTGEVDKDTNTATVQIQSNIANYASATLYVNGDLSVLDSGDVLEGYISLPSGKHNLKICATNDDGEACSDEVSVVISKNIELPSYKQFLLKDKSRALTNDGHQIIYGTYSGEVYSLDLSSKISTLLGNTNDEIGALSYINDGHYYYSETTNGKIVKINIVTGDKENIASTRFPDGMDFYNNKIYSVTEDSSGVVTIFNKEGDKLNTLDTKIDDMVGITHTDKFLYILAENGSIYQTNSTTGESTKIFTNDNLFDNSENGNYGLEGITILNRKIYVSYINDQSIYLIDIDLSDYE